MSDFSHSPFVRRWLRPFLILSCVAAGIVALALGVMASTLRNIPPIEELESYDPKQATRILDRSGETTIGNFVDEHREVIRLRDLPPYVGNAFVAIEDSRFFEHFGVDPKSVARASVINLRRGRFSQGFSTLTLQLPRNILPERIGREKTLRRKLEEALLALHIEKRYSKEQILEFYVNQVYLGAGSYGVEAAARNYFNRDAAELTLAQAATIAGLPQRPSVDNPWINPDAALKRRNIVLDRMRQQGWIDSTQYQMAIGEPLGCERPAPLSRTAPYFVEHIRSRLSADSQFNNRDLHQKGFEIESTLDVDLQRIVDAALREGLVAAEAEWHAQKNMRLDAEDAPRGPPRPGQTRLAPIERVTTGVVTVRVGEWIGAVMLPESLPFLRPDSILKEGELLDVKVGSLNPYRKSFQATLVDQNHIQGAVVVLDASNSEILAMNGGADFFDEAADGQWNRATRSARQPGSCFKPLIFAYALESGQFEPTTQLNDRKIQFGNYVPRNYEGRHFGPTTLQESLEKSRNIPTILAYRRLGIREANAFARRFDFIPERDEWELRAEIPTCLGNTDINLLELTAAYATFANGGVGARPRAVRKVARAQDGVRIADFPVEARRVVSRETAYQMTAMLMGVMRDGTGSETLAELESGRGAAGEGESDAAMKWPEIAGKTGTTNDCVDALFVGYTPRLVIGVRVGFDQPRSMGPKMTGGRIAGPIFADIARRAIAERPDWAEPRRFPIPPTIVLRDVDRETAGPVPQGAPASRVMRVAIRR